MEAEDSDQCDRVLRIELIPEIPRLILVTDTTVHADGNDAMMVEQRVKKIQVRSKVLGAKSDYFRKLFAVGMAETSQREVTIKLTASEEPSFRRLIKHMSGHTWELMGLNAEGLLSLLVITPKYDAKECMRFCSDELKKVMTENVALACLQLESWIQMEKEVQSLNKYAFEYLGKITMYSLSVETKDYFVSRYKDFEKFQDKLLNFPLDIIQAIISSDCLEVSSEDVVYNFVCKWAKANYHPGRARCDVLRQLARYIRFRYMSPETLRKFSKSHEFEPDVAPPIVLDALFFKAEVPLDNNANQFRERVYKFRPVKVLRFQLPQSACSVYFDLPHSVCKEMFPSGHVYSEKVELGRNALHLCAACESQQGMEPYFGLFLVLKTQNPITVDVQFEARAKPSRMFKPLYSSICTLTKDHKIGSPNLFNMVWPSFIEEDAEYFCGGALYFRAEIKLRE